MLFAVAIVGAQHAVPGRSNVGRLLAAAIPVRVAASSHPTLSFAIPEACGLLL